MPLFKKLFFTRNEPNKSVETSLLPNNGANDRKAVAFQSDQIRVLLFHECERRGECKLLFDSIAVEKFPVKTRCEDLKGVVEQKDDVYIEIDNEFIYEYKRVERDDVKLLKDMVFGNVAMTYRGPSFKIHVMDAPRRIMCTKVFPASEQSLRQHSERHSSEALVNSMTMDGNSSNGSMLAVGKPMIVPQIQINHVSHTNLANSYGNRLSPELRKNSTSSSTGSSWDLDIPFAPPARDSLQLLESSSSSSGVGSLSSLRRRWLRTLSTSLNRSESEDLYGAQYFSTDGSHDSSEHQTRRQKTRIGLAVLLELTEGHERRMEARLLEHVALLEGMLDRLRRSCSKGSHNKSRGFVVRMHQASLHCTLWLLRLFMDTANLPTPLLWHNILLTPNTSGELKVHTLQRSLQLMCRLLDDVDTKSTNFFLSTLVTAVLTHHLGWVHTVLSSSDRQLVESLAKRYSYNPLWAQLCDLYGALGTPLRVAHTVIVGETEKTDLINTVLTFLSYFIRSSNIERRRERRSSPERELQQAVTLLKEAEARRPASLRSKRGSIHNVNDSAEPNFTRQMNAASSMYRNVAKERFESPSHDSLSRTPRMADFSRNIETKASKLKRSDTTLQNLSAITLGSDKTCVDSSVKYKSFYDNECEKSAALDADCMEKDQNSNSVKIVVSETLPLEPQKRREYLQRSAPLQELENKINYGDFEEAYLDAKLESLERYRKNDFDANKLCSNGIDSVDSTVLEVKQENCQKEQNVSFVLGGEEKSIESKLRSQEKCYCQCAFSFTRVPSTSAQLSEGVLRKIIQRNFPESSKSIKANTSSAKERSTSFCPNCFGESFTSPHTYDNNSLLLETPTNATEVLRICSSASAVNNRGVRMNRRNSLEYLMEANGVVELPMPRSKKIVPNSSKEVDPRAGFSGSLQFGEVCCIDTMKKSDPSSTGYTWGVVAQGLAKRKKKKRRKKSADDGKESEDEWLSCVRDEVEAAVHSSVVDQPIAEALCIVADVDSWQVGVLSNNTPLSKAPLAVGMSRLVANMLEAFAYVWRKYHSPVHCIGVLEGKLREMWLRSEALAEMLMGAELEDVSVDSLTDALDLDAADIPVLLAVAATHSPIVARRFGLSLA
ncbi:folliculin-interacting protein 2 isoform X1 [Athalia rosae]|uniref:folliculin-interacting protein 2 isoform X1 n=2 Tax=Athalia rosae TaxID=37344 RepID=UPI00203378FD|nr:folliculin-interacting protein 2 isoform X1 [Athalia rosae]